MARTVVDCWQASFAMSSEEPDRLKVEIEVAEPRQSSDPVPLVERHPSLVWVGERFALLVDALRDMTDDVVPQLEAVDVSRLTPDALAAMDAIPLARQERLREAITLVFELPAELAPDELNERESKIERALNDAFQGDLHVAGTFFESMRRAAASPDRVSIMRNSMLLQAISGFEVLVAGVATQFYVTHPKAIESTDKEFSLSELQDFADIEDAIDALIARRVSKLMYGDLEDWAAFLKERCKADLPRLAQDWDAVLENFQRRHVLVHNGGLVSRQYLSKVPVRFREEYVLGHRLRADDDYLHRAFDELDILGASIILAARSGWSEEDTDRAAVALLSRVYSLMLRKRWRAVARLSALRQFVDTKAAIAEALRANELCARSRLEGPEAIREEAETWDVSASAGRFTLVRMVLLEDLDRAISTVPELLARKELTLGELQTWPILEPVRAHAGWKALAAQVGISQDEPE